MRAGHVLGITVCKGVECESWSRGLSVRGSSVRAGHVLCIMSVLVDSLSPLLHAHELRQALIAAFTAASKSAIRATQD